MTDFNMKRTWGPTPNYPGVIAHHENFRPTLMVLAGPCSVENEGQAKIIVKELARNQVMYARGGVYRAGTYPGKVFGFQPILAKVWADLCHKAGLRVVMECLDIRELDEMAKIADAIQIGARHMQDYALLKEASQLDCRVFLKRHPGSTLDEFLGAAEYLCKGNCAPALIERGSSTHMNHVRWDLSISIIPAIKNLTKIPILIDASHGTGRRDLVEPMIMAGVAAGADGFLVEVHPNPELSLSDADQAYPLDGLKQLIQKANSVKQAVRYA